MIEFPEKEKVISLPFLFFVNKRTDWTFYFRKDCLIGLLTRKQRIYCFSDIGFSGYEVHKILRCHPAPDRN